MKHNTITENQSQTQRYIVVRSTLDSYIHSPRSHLGFLLYSLWNTVEFVGQVATQEGGELGLL